MTTTRRTRSSCVSRRYGERRRGAVAILAVFLMVVLVGMLAMAIDIGYLAASKTEIQRTADSAALAACWQIYESKVAGIQDEDAKAKIAASDFARLNSVSSTYPLLNTTGSGSDVQLGYLGSLAHNSALTTNTNDPFRAVHVRVQKSSTSNGEVPLYFARIFGKQGMSMSADATAAMAQQVRGFQISEGSNLKIHMLPFALDIQTWQALQAGNAPDQFKYNQNGTVSSGTDGIREVNLYPQGTGSPGNRGTVDIGGSNNSTADIARQILHGISAQDFIDMGTPLVFNNDGYLELNGDTGISAGIKDELTSIIGKTRIIPIFESVSGNGNNATYRIVQWAGVRILNVKLTGSMSSKKVIVQPAPILTKGIVAGDASRKWSESVFSPVILTN